MTYFPFGQVPALSQPPVAYDIVMSKTYPRIGFMPTESGGIYQEIVEVGGDLWILSNATYDVNKIGFYQETSTLVNCNASHAAFAWCHRGLTGDAIRFYSIATNNPNTAITWIQTFDASPVSTVVSPLAQSAANSTAFAVNATFNASASTSVRAFAINVNNISSSSLSPLEIFSVNNVPVWMVDTTGTLQIGNISSATLVPQCYTILNAGTGIAPIGAAPVATIGLAHDDYVDLPNVQTITGVKTIQSVNTISGLPPTPLFLGSGSANIVGGADDGLYLCSGATITNFGASFTALANSPNAMILAGKQSVNNQMLTLYIDTGLTVNSTYTPTAWAYFSDAGNFTTQGDITVGGQLSVTGAVNFTGGLTIGGTLTLNGNLVLSGTTVQALENYFEGQKNSPYNYSSNNNAGLAIGYDSGNTAIVLDTSRLAYIGPNNSSGIISSDNSVTVTKNMNTGSVSSPNGTQTVDLSVSTSVKGAFPVYDYGSSTKLATPQCIVGSQTALTAGSSGFGGLSSANFTFGFAQPFSTGYKIALSLSGGFLVGNVTAKTLSSCTVNVSFLSGGPGNVTCDIVCVGN